MKPALTASITGSYSSAAPGAERKGPKAPLRRRVRWFAFALVFSAAILLLALSAGHDYLQSRILDSIDAASGQTWLAGSAGD